MKIANVLLGLVVPLLLNAPSAPQIYEPAEPVPVGRPNIVLIIVDDIGVDKIGAYQEGPPGVMRPCTPNIDRLAGAGLLFRNAWTNPICSPSRAQILTGRHSFRTGIGVFINTTTNEKGLSVDLETTLPEILNGYDHSAVGKWHLANREETMGNGQGLQHPLKSGYNFFSGSMGNLGKPALPCGTGCNPPNCPLPLGYSSWVKTEDTDSDGVLDQACATKYPTIDTTDDALARAQVMQKPWFLYVSYNAAHTPVHDPPPGICPNHPSCSNDHCPSNSGQASPLRVNAMIEALDTEIGRLLSGIAQIAPQAIVFFIGDNGTSKKGAQGMNRECWDPMKSKGTVYEGGVNVPLIVKGPGVIRGESTQLVSSTDLFATIAELGHANPISGIDSVSFRAYLAGSTTPLRQHVYAEKFRPNFTTPDHPSTPPFTPDTHTRAIRNDTYKLIRFTDNLGGVEEQLFNLVTDPCEKNDLCTTAGVCDVNDLMTLEDWQAYLELRDELIAMGVY